jgi:hypothetical protein
MIKPKPERIRALALGTAIAATSPLPASAAEFTAVDLYHICSAGMDLNGDINDTQACFNFLGQVWGRGVITGEICAANPVNNMQIAMTFTTGLWRLPPEYLSQRADIGAAAVFRVYFPCHQAATPSTIEGSRATFSCSTNDMGRTLLGDNQHQLPKWAEHGYEILGKTPTGHQEMGWTDYTCTIGPPSATAKACLAAASKVPHGASSMAIDTTYAECMTKHGRLY